MDIYVLINNLKKNKLILTMMAGIFLIPLGEFLQIQETITPINVYAINTDNQLGSSNTLLSFFGTNNIGSVKQNDDSTTDIKQDYLEKGKVNLHNKDKQYSSSSSSISSSFTSSAQPGTTEIFADFNGDGFGDLAIGLPFDNVGIIPAAGAVNVIYGSKNGLSTNSLPDQYWTQDSLDIEDDAEANDYFGNRLTSGDFNGDGRDDLAIGVGGEDVGTLSDVGAVEVIYGSKSGLSATAVLPDQFWTQDSPDIEDVAENSDQFGTSLSSGDFNGDGRDDLAIGIFGEDVGTLSDVGAVEVIYGSKSGLSATAVLPDQFWTQDSPDVEDVAEQYDTFGMILSSGDFNGDGRDDLAMGSPNESVSSFNFAGAVNVIYGSSSGLSATAVLPDQFWTQDSTDIDDLVEYNDGFGVALSSGDYNGDGIDDLAIAAFEEDVGVIADAGAVNVIYGSSSGLSATAVLPDQFWTQDSPDVEDVAEDSDWLSSLTSGDYNDDGRDDLAIGASFEDVGAIADAGAVNVIYGSSSGLSATAVLPDQFWTQDSTNILATADEDDLFGNKLTSGDYNGDGRDDLAIGTPYEDIRGVDDDIIQNAGGVNIIYGSGSGLSAVGNQFWTNSPNIIASNNLNVDNRLGGGL